MIEQITTTVYVCDKCGTKQTKKRKEDVDCWKVIDDVDSDNCNNLKHLCPKCTKVVMDTSIGKEDINKMILIEKLLFNEITNELIHVDYPIDNHILKQLKYNAIEYCKNIYNIIIDLDIIFNVRTRIFEISNLKILKY